MNIKHIIPAQSGSFARFRYTKDGKKESDRIYKIPVLFWAVVTKPGDNDSEKTNDIIYGFITDNLISPANELDNFVDYTYEPSWSSPDASELVKFR